VAPSVEHGLCSETSVQSSDNSNEVVTIKVVGEVVRIKRGRRTYRYIVFFNK
jgi:hypothetical protein